jgi:glycosyltransferase involved in cell wall biosynthesis
VARHVKAESGRCTNVFEVPQAVDNHYFRRRASEGDRVGTRARFDLADGPVACYAGRLEEGKGLDVLLRALTKVATPEQLLIVGEGGLRADLDELACDLRISDRVRFAEYVEQSTLPDVLGAVDFLVLPSVTTKRFREPWGLVVNEAMSSGLPVIASDAVGAAAAGLVVDDVTGLIVPEGDAAALATAMERLAADPGLRSRLATAAGQHVFRWSFEAAAAGLADAIRAAAAGMEAADAGLAHA